MVPAEAQRGDPADPVDALVRARPVADDVAQAPQLVRLLADDVCEHRLERMEIGMDV